MNPSTVVTRTEIKGLSVRRGKVRDVYDLGDRLLLVATDRISAYDVVMPTPIPDKGRMLTLLSRFWFEFFGDSVPNHFIRVIESDPPPQLAGHFEQIRGRATLCRKAEVIPIECVVRGYLAGSGWKEYQSNRAVCGIALPAGLRECDLLPDPIFTPATKVEDGHDENISFEQTCQRVGADVMSELKKRSLDLYTHAREYAATRGIIIADTKFEFGYCDGEIILIDEVLTPDSSRFWPAAQYEPGRDQDSFDKQYVRNYLTTLVQAGRWDKSPPGPELPAEIVRNTAARYREAYERLTGAGWVSS